MKYRSRKEKAVSFCRNYVVSLLIVFEQPYMYMGRMETDILEIFFYVAIPEIEFLHKNVTCNTEAECGTVQPPTL